MVSVTRKGNPNVGAQGSQQHVPEATPSPILAALIELAEKIENIDNTTKSLAEKLEPIRNLSGNVRDIGVAERESGSYCDYERRIYGCVDQLSVVLDRLSMVYADVCC